MSERRSHFEATQRQQPKETNPPPSYHEAVNTESPSRPHHDLPVPRSPSHPNGYSSQNTSLTRMSADSFRVSAELRTHIKIIRPITQQVDALIRRKLSEEQREIKPSENETSGMKWESIWILRRKVATRDRMVHHRDRTIHHRDRMIQRRDRMLQQKNHSVKSISARLAAVEAALRGEEQKPTYLDNIGLKVFSLAESIFRVAQTALGFLRPRVEIFTGPYWLHAWIWGFHQTETASASYSL